MQSQGQTTDMRPGSSLLLLPGVVTEANGGGPHFSIEGGWYCWSVPLISPVPNPEDQYVAAQMRGRVSAVVAALPQQTRCCLQLRGEGLRYREIAEVLDISLGTVSACLEEALARIARATER
jgi:RNA polymerase sigma factor (sigma-70 family)